MQTYHANVGTRASLTVRANTVYTVCEVSKGRDSIVSVSGTARGDQCADMPGRWAWSQYSPLIGPHDEYCGQVRCDWSLGPDSDYCG